MPHHTSLIATIVVGLGLAFICGVLANRLRLSPLVGYLLAGVLVGPFTPGFVADQALAPQLAEIGVILLMFGVGLHFSLKDLLAVRTIAVLGAIGQIALVTLLGFGLAQVFGWGWGAGVIFGLALSVASTVVVLHVLQERRLLETERGRIAVGWLVVEDLVMVLALVLIPALAGLMGGQPVHQTEGSEAEPRKGKEHVGRAVWVAGRKEDQDVSTRCVEAPCRQRVAREHNGLLRAVVLLKRNVLALQERPVAGRQDCHGQPSVVWVRTV